MKIAIGNDHVALDMKNHIKKYLEEKGHMVVDFGTNTPERTDYPIYAKKVADAIVSKQCELGVLICGTGVGISIAANKVKGIRAAVCSEPYSAHSPVNTTMQILLLLAQEWLVLPLQKQLLMLF